jgi:hypothetical protein
VPAYTVEIEGILGRRKKTVSGPLIRCEKDAVDHVLHLQYVSDRHGRPMAPRGEIVDAYPRLAGKPLPPSAINAIDKQPMMLPIFMNLR